ncbi:MAG: four helix bundle protein [Acidobacteriia bacterium]|nr:four helix bundle protein [Terriglobia bacterium]
MITVKDYKELEVWQKAVDLATSLYEVTRGFPDTEKFGLVVQVRRAATSVPANIAEGWGRGSTREYVQFLHVARGSLLELETHLIIAQKLAYLSRERSEVAHQQVKSISMMLNRLIGALRAR